MTPSAFTTTFVGGGPFGPPITFCVLFLYTARGVPPTANIFLVKQQGSFSPLIIFVAVMFLFVFVTVMFPNEMFPVDSDEVKL